MTEHCHSKKDPFHEGDPESHARLTEELGIEIIGDDLFTKSKRVWEIERELGRSATWLGVDAFKGTKQPWLRRGN